MEKYLLKKHPRHTHWWIHDGYLHESYNTIRGVRHMVICKVFDAKNSDLISDEKAELLIKQNKP